MNIFLLRHGLAVEPESVGIAKDSERPLTPKGERKLWKIAQAIAALELSFDWVLASPYVRARQTAEIVAEALGLGNEIQLTESLVPAGSMKKLIELMNHRKPAPANVLLVGHEPYLSDLISVLISGGTDLEVTMKKGGFCKLSTASLEHGRCAVLEWLLTPKHLCLMA